MQPVPRRGQPANLHASTHNLKRIGDRLGEGTRESANAEIRQRSSAPPTVWRHGNQRGAQVSPREKRGASIWDDTSQADREATIKFEEWKRLEELAGDRCRRRL